MIGFWLHIVMAIPFQPREKCLNLSLSVSIGACFFVSTHVLGLFSCLTLLSHWESSSFLFFAVSSWGSSYGNCRSVKC